MKIIEAPPFPEPLPIFPSPWQTKSTRQVYKNPWLSLREDSVVTPKGSDGIYSVIDSRIATAVVALDQGQNVFLVGQYRYPTKHFSWEVIEGGSEGTQTALETAKRELTEEAGLTARQWIQLGDEFHLSNCFSSERAFAFLARELAQVESQPDDTEVLTLIKIPFRQAQLRLNSGEIKDALSIIALRRAELFLKEEGTQP